MRILKKTNLTVGKSKPHTVCPKITPKQLWLWSPYNINRIHFTSKITFQPNCPIPINKNEAWRKIMVTYFAELVTFAHQVFTLARGKNDILQQSLATTSFQRMASSNCERLASNIKLEKIEKAGQKSKGIFLVKLSQKLSLNWRQITRCLPFNKFDWMDTLQGMMDYCTLFMTKPQHRGQITLIINRAEGVVVIYVNLCHILSHHFLALPTKRRSIIKLKPD